MKDAISYIKQFPVRNFSKGQLIIEPGAEASMFYAIQTGFAKTYSIDTSGEERLLWIAGRYDIVPSELFFSKAQRLNYFYAAISDVSAYEIDKTEFLRHAQNEAGVMNEIARAMSNHYDDLLYRLQSLEQATVRQKLMYTLLNLATRFSSEDIVEFRDLGLALTHHDIGSLIGSTRETTAIELKKLKDLEVIDYDRNSFRVTVSKLQALVDA